MDKSDKSAKNIYLGSVDTSKKVQKEPLDVNKLLTLEHEGSVVNIACSNCGVVVEGAQGNADALCRAANVPLRKDFKCKYFLTSSCFVCRAENGEITVELKNISDLIN